MYRIVRRRTASSYDVGGDWAAVGGGPLAPLRRGSFSKDVEKFSPQILDIYALYAKIDSDERITGRLLAA